MPGRLTYGDIDAISCRVLARRFLRRDRESIARYMVRVGSTDERKIRMWSDRSRLIDAPSITPGGLTRQNGGRSHGIQDGRALPIFRVLFQLLVHPWTVALANATIVLVLALGFLYMQRTGMEPLKTAEEVISGLGVILIGWGVALEERHKLREIFGLTGEREAREEAIDETCHRFGLGLLLFGSSRKLWWRRCVSRTILSTRAASKNLCWLRQWRCSVSAPCCCYGKSSCWRAPEKSRPDRHCAAIADPRNKSIAAPA